MLQSYLELSLIALLPSVFAGLFTVYIKKKKITEPLNIKQQIVVGLIFGLLAIMGTEFGIPVNGAQINCRDAAVLTAGLFFGAPAGMIAGFIGGIERWFAVYWGIGTFTRLACTVSTILAGFIGAFFRKFMFENKKSGTLISFAIGIVTEVIHMTMVFVTNMANPVQALSVVKSCSAVMITANGIAVMLSAFAVQLVSGRLINRNKKIGVSQTIQKGLLITVAFAFLVTTVFVYFFQNTMSNSQRDSLLSIAISQTSADIQDASNSNILQMTEKVKADIETQTLKDLAEQYGLSEIHTVNGKGIITDSTNADYVGINVSEDNRCAEFLCLLKGTREYVQDFGISPFDRTQSLKYAGIAIDNGFIMVGLNAAALQKEIDSHVVGITKNRYVGENGYVLILDQSLNVISAPKDFTMKNFSRTEQRIEFPDPDVTFLIQLNGVSYFGRYQNTEGYYILALYAQAQALQSRDVALYTNTFLQVIVYAVLFVFIYLLIKKVVVNQIKKINSSLAKITGGDLNVVVDVRSNEEFESLSDDINSTVDTLKAYIAEASARIDKELEFAKNIQFSALPSNFSVVNNRSDVEIFASMNPAKEVGGDFYDFYFTDQNTLNFLIADVSGKGIPAAMFMMRAKTELKSLTEAQLSVHEVFTQGNNDLCEGNDAGMFVTAWQGAFNLQNGTVSFANAGHNPPIVLHEGEFSYLKSKAGFILAGMEDVPYKKQELTLSPGDIIYLYTDGVTEATNEAQELYGEERLLNTMKNCSFRDVQELCRAVKADVDAFVGDAPQFDDITMLALRYLG